MKSRCIRWTRQVALIGDMIEGKRQLIRCKRKWEHAIKTDLNETEYEGVDWIHETQDRT